jgi:hypothetical protein
VSKEDFANLVKKYPSQLKDLWGDLGVVVGEFELWKTIDYFDYEFLVQNAIKSDDYLVISVEKMLVQKALSSKEKHQQDLKLIARMILDEQAKKFQTIKQENKAILEGLEDINFVEKTGPDLDT